MVAKIQLITALRVYVAPRETVAVKVRTNELQLDSDSKRTAVYQFFALYTDKVLSLSARSM
jgi:hypothetical protein